ncbi:MAG TPA: uroporphyrinogen-III C-methyltransferase, partial [Gammaproteobacteria bacterium]|nr:uroporphyrinogen-III C-methyltransferase [Gammaproteobacteria bacterium]
PEEKMFLYQNLHAQMEGAMWAVLQHNTAIYQASLARAIVWITHYFDPAAAVSTTLLQQLQTLEKTNLQPATANLADTLQLFDQYFAGEK